MRDEQWDMRAQPTSPRVRDGLELLKRRLPEHAPYCGWSRFQFLPFEGGFLEVDALVVSPAGIFLIGLETFGGRLECRGGTWRHVRQNGETELHEHPVQKLRYQAGELRKVVDRHLPSTVEAPRLQPLVFLTESELEVETSGEPPECVAYHPEHPEMPSVLEVVTEGEGPGISTYTGEVDRKVAGRLETALDEAGLLPADRTFRVGPWELGELVDAGPKYKDYVAEHGSDDREDVLRARVFWPPRGASDDSLERLQEAARREASLLRELDHPGILQVHDRIGHETRPTILFDHPEDARRLDRVAEAGELPSPRRRLKILERVADAVRYAHDQKIVHRALTPHSVLLVDGADDVRVFNWHTGRKPDHETGTRHVSDYLEHTAKFFLAPELLSRPTVDEAADVFGLGALAYFLFAEQPPATSLPEHMQSLGEQGGLRLSAVPDIDVSPHLDDLIYEATRPDPADRLASAGEFLDALDDYWGRHGGSPSERSDPTAAQPNDRIGDRWEVVKRLGTGSTATALHARTDDGRDVVLKIADDAHQAEYLAAEAEALRSIDSDYVVDLYEQTEVGGRETLVLQHAGRTLGQELRERSALSIDEQRRYGRHLCEIVRDLERAQLHHRDIKPSNIGVEQLETNRGPTALLLFDFSLHGVPIEQTHVGTDAYRDPFLVERTQWDLAADRYAAALVLYQMVTQELPSWGESVNPAAVEEAELELHDDRFPAPVRSELVEFFRTALARDVDDRFESGEAMSAAWREIYETTLHSRHETADLESVSPDTRLVDIGLSSAGLDQLGTLGLETVADFVEASSEELHFKTGAGGEVRDELVALHERLVELFPQVAEVGDGERPARSEESFAAYSIDMVLEVLEEKPDGFGVDLELADGGFRRLVRLVLGSKNHEFALPWARAEELRDRLERKMGLGPHKARRALDELERAWSRKRVLPPLQNDLVDLIDEDGGVAADRRVADGLLGRRGSAEIDDRDDRLAAAAAVGRAALVAELASDDPRVELRRRARGGDRSPVFVATRPEMLDVLDPLAECAGKLAAATSIPSPRRASRALRDVMEAAGLEPLPRKRLLQVAAAASPDAAMSTQEELYPVGMSAVRAIRLTTGLLRRRAPLSAEQLRDAVRSRYPEAEELPEHPALEKVVEEADIGLEWDPEAEEGRGRYVSKYDTDRASPALSALADRSSSWRSSVPGESGEAVAEETRTTLQNRASSDGFFVIQAEQGALQRTAEILAAAFDLAVVSTEKLLIEEIRRSADREGVPWKTVLEADAMDWDEQADVRRQLERRVFLTGRDEESVAWRVRQRLLDHDAERMLLVDNGLLGRWDELLRWNVNGERMQIVHALHDRTRQEGPSVVWMLVPHHPDSKMPKLGPQPVPVDESDYFFLKSGVLDALR